VCQGVDEKKALNFKEVVDKWPIKGKMVDKSTFGREIGRYLGIFGR
jgi:hypothetical protein